MIQSLIPPVYLSRLVNEHLRDALILPSVLWCECRAFNESAAVGRLPIPWERGSRARRKRPGKRAFLITEGGTRLYPVAVHLASPRKEHHWAGRLRHTHQQFFSQGEEQGNPFPRRFIPFLRPSSEPWIHSPLHFVEKVLYPPQVHWTGHGACQSHRSPYTPTRLKGSTTMPALP